MNQQVYRALKQAIVTCAIAPGAPLSEKEVAERFGTSRQPVREAFIKLAENGLVEIRPQRGTFVMKIDAKRVADGRFIREAIEVAVVRRAAAIIDSAHLAILDDNIAQQEKAAAAKDLVQFLELDEGFHRTIARSIDCIAAWEAVENIKASMDRVRFLTLANVSPLEQLIQQHRRIVEGLSRHDVDRAETAMHVHLQEMVRTFTPTASLNPQWFE